VFCIASKTVSCPVKTPRYAMEEWVAFSKRSFISSKERTELVNSTPTSSRGGRGRSAKSSSITHCQNGSCKTGAGSGQQVNAAISSTSCAVTAGTIRSTMVAGNRTFSLIHCARSGSIFCANSSTTVCKTRPFSDRLSQLRQVKAFRPNARLCRNA